jgi:hypothetical protein
MAAIPQLCDPSLALADQEIVKAQEKRFRPYLGMSQIGDECSRQIWYSFRQAKRPDFDAPTLKRFADGHASETVAVNRLKAVEQFEVHDVGEDGEQFGFKDLGGHFSGHMDGVILGLVQAPKTWHVLEIKSSAKWKDLDKATKKVGEKNALAAWNPTYYAQAVLYMDYAGLDRHYTVVVSPGARDATSCRTNVDPAHAGVLKAKAERIIFTDTAPDRIGGPDFYKCKWCDFSDICHQGKLSERNCRTCLHSEACRDGSWQCRNPDFPHELSKADQEAGCDAHRYLPTLIAGEQVNIECGGIVYRMADGSEWADRGQGI